MLTLQQVQVMEKRIPLIGETQMRLLFADWHRMRAALTAIQQRTLLGSHDPVWCLQVADDALQEKLP